jgi:hypothetical protein
MSPDSSRNAGGREGSSSSPRVCVCVEPAQIPIEGIFPPRALSRVEPSAHQSSHVTTLSRHAISGSANNAYMLANFTEETLTISKATVLGVAEEGSESLIE